jgi:hypothetical protein
MIKPSLHHEMQFPKAAERFGASRRPRIGATSQVSVHYTGCKTLMEARGRNLIPAKTVANHFNLRLDKVRSSKVGMKGYKG